VINPKQLCVKFCNFVQCHIFVNYLTFAVNELNIKYNKIETSRNTTVSACTYAIEIYYSKRSWRAYNSFV
jgi:hypothetical protein